MSYCRWSSLNWTCDVYVYADAHGGWTTHVATRRRVVPAIPDLPLMRLPRLGRTWNKQTGEAEYPSRLHEICGRVVIRLWAFWHERVHMASLNLIPLRPIGKAHDGETFNDPTPTDCADRIERLRDIGYIVPQRAIDALRDEAREDAGDAATHRGQ